MKFKVKGHNNLVKDSVSGAIINTNTEEMDRYKSSQAAMVARKKSENTEQRLDALEKNVGEIKELLLKVLNNANI